MLSAVRFLVIAAVIVSVLAGLMLAIRRDRPAWAFMRRLRALGWRRSLTGAVELVRDGRVPVLIRLVPVPLLLYLALPVDLVPDFIPLLGQVDDLLVAAVAAWLMVHLIPGHVLDEHFPLESDHV